MQNLKHIYKRVKSILQSPDKHYLNNKHLSSQADIDLEKHLAIAQAAWTEKMKKYKNEAGIIIFPNEAPNLSDKHIANCRLLPHRIEILKRMKTGGTITEVGVQTGRFSDSILEICKPAKLHLIDIDLKKYSIEEKFKKEIENGLVELHEGDSSTILHSFPDKYFDIIYIDADHSYEGVKLDTEAAKLKVKDDGYLIFNDYTFWSPVECMPYGILRAVNEFCINENWEMVYYALAEYMYCDVALKKISTAS